MTITINKRTILVVTSVFAGGFFTGNVLTVRNSKKRLNQKLTNIALSAIANVDEEHQNAVLDVLAKVKKVI